MKKLWAILIIVSIIGLTLPLLAEQLHPQDQAKMKEKLSIYQAESQKDYFREKALEIIDMKTYQKFLEDQLKEAREEIRRLREAMPKEEVKKEEPK